MLYGSSILPSIIHYDGKQLQLGDIVRYAHKQSGLTVDEWNDLTEFDREVKLISVLADYCIGLLDEVACLLLDEAT